MEVSNRDRDNCKNCIYYNYLNCFYVKLDDYCSITGNKVAIDYTYNRSFNDNTKYK